MTVSSCIASSLCWVLMIQNVGFVSCSQFVFFSLEHFVRGGKYISTYNKRGSNCGECKRIVMNMFRGII